MPPEMKMPRLFGTKIYEQGHSSVIYKINAARPAAAAIPAKAV
jgi:hypothetical protein